MCFGTKKSTPWQFKTHRLLISTPQDRLGMNQIKTLISLPTPRSTTRQTTEKIGSSRRGATPVASSHHIMASGLLMFPPFWKTTLVCGSHKWKLDFTFTISTRTKTVYTRYLQPSRNRASLPKYPTAHGIHQHKISISLSRLNSLHALAIPKSVNFTVC
jgi:hypothetical protein